MSDLKEVTKSKTSVVEYNNLSSNLKEEVSQETYDFLLDVFKWYRSLSHAYLFEKSKKNPIVSFPVCSSYKEVLSKVPFMVKESHPDVLDLSVHENQVPYTVQFLKNSNVFEKVNIFIEGQSVNSILEKEGCHQGIVTITRGIIDLFENSDNPEIVPDLEMIDKAIYLYKTSSSHIKESKMCKMEQQIEDLQKEFSEFEKENNNLMNSCNANYFKYLEKELAKD